MADQKISQLSPASTPLAGTEVLPIVQSGSTVKVAVSDLTTGRPISAAGVTDSTLTASKGVFTDASKKLTSTGTLGSDQGGTGNGFTKFTGPTTAEKTFTLPNANATLARTDTGQTFTGTNVVNGRTLYAITKTVPTGATTNLISIAVGNGRAGTLEIYVSYSNGSYSNASSISAMLNYSKSNETAVTATLTQFNSSTSGYGGTAGGYSSIQIASVSGGTITVSVTLSGFSPNFDTSTAADIFGPSSGLTISAA